MASTSPPRRLPGWLGPGHLPPQSERENARRLGLPRRAFLASASGAATGLLALNRAFAAQQPGGTFQVPPTAALDVDEAFEVAGRPRADRRRADPLRRPERPVAQESLFHLEHHPARVSPGPLRRGAAGAHLRVGRLLLRAPLRQGGLPRQRHRPGGADLRPLAARGHAAVDRGGGQDPPDRRRARGDQAPAGARPRPPQPAGRAGPHGRAGRALEDRGLEDLHRLRPRRQRLLARRPEGGHPLHRAGAGAGDQGHLRAQGAAAARARSTNTPPAATSAWWRRPSPTSPSSSTTRATRRGRRRGPTTRRAGGRHRQPDRLAAEERDRPQPERLRRAGQHLAPADARPGQRGARPGQAVQIRRRGPGAVGDRFDLVRLAPGPDRRLPRRSRSPPSCGKNTATRRSRRSCGPRYSPSTPPPPTG